MGRNKKPQRKSLENDFENSLAKATACGAATETPARKKILLIKRDKWVTIGAGIGCF